MRNTRGIRSLLVAFALVAVVGSLSPTSPAVAGRSDVSSAGTASATLPAYALAVVRRYQLDRWAGYGKVRNECASCLAGRPNYPYDDYALQDLYWSGVNPAGQVVFVDTGDEANQGDRFVVSVFNPTTFQRLSMRSTPSQAPFGANAFLVAPDGTYWTFGGRGNDEENDDYTVAVVRHWDPQLNLLGTARVKAGLAEDFGIYTTPVASSTSMALSGNRLIVTTGRFIYHQPNDAAPHHQASLTFAVDTATLQTTWLSPPYTSHSFNGFVNADGSDAVFVNHGDAYPRAVVLERIDGGFAGGESSIVPMNLFPLRGATGDNFTGTTVNALDVGPSGALVTGVSVPHGHPIQGVSGRSRNLAPNVYLIAANPDTRTKSFRWLTTFKPTMSPWVWVSQPRMAKLSADRFAVLYTVHRRTGATLNYVLVNSAGTVLVRKAWSGTFPFAGAPAVSRKRIFWVGIHGAAIGPPGSTRTPSRYLYGIGVADPAAPRLLRR